MKINVKCTDTASKVTVKCISTATKVANAFNEGFSLGQSYANQLMGDK